MTAEYQITIEPLGREVTCREDQTILDACLRAGVWVPHSCTHGTCATCKAEVLEGEVDHGEASSFALMDFERDEGKSLLCVAQARSPTSSSRPTSTPTRRSRCTRSQDYVGTLVALDDVALDTRRLVIELDRDLTLQRRPVHVARGPGQRRRHPHVLDGQPARRSRGVLEFQIRRTAGGLATDGWIFKDLAVGDTDRAVSGPYGRFVLRERPQRARGAHRRRHRPGARSPR